MNVDEELSKILSESIAREIDEEILTDIAIFSISTENPEYVDKFKGINIIPTIKRKFEKECTELQNFASSSNEVWKGIEEKMFVILEINKFKEKDENQYIYFICRFFKDYNNLVKGLKRTKKIEQILKK